MKTDKIPLVAALYARVSTERQENEETIESQIAEVKHKIEVDGNSLSPLNIFSDNGWTGMILVRPALDLMRDAIKEGRIQIVYVYDLGRLSRDFTDQLILLREFEQAGIKFVSLRDVNPTTPAEEMVQKVMGIFHDYDRRNTVEKFRRGKLYKARLGEIINGGALYGYAYIKKADDKTPAEIKVNKKEAEIVRMIFRWVGIDGLSIRGVIMKLYRMRIYPRKRKRDAWSKGPIVRMLKNRSYVDGIAYYNKSEAVVSQNPIKKDKYKKIKRTSRRVRPQEEWIPFKISKLIDENLFNCVQKILEDNKRYASKNRKYDYLLTGKTYCEHGFRRVGDGYSKGQNHYYRSAARIYEYPKETECDCAGVNAVVLDGLFWKKIHEILINPVLLRKLAERWFKMKDSYSKSSGEEINNLKKQIDNLRVEEVRYARMRGESVIDNSQFEELMRGVKNKKRLYQTGIDDIKKRNDEEHGTSISLDELCQEAESVIKLQDISDKKQIIRDLVEKVVIKKGGDEVETWINIPLNQAHLMGYGAISRNSWFTKRRKVYTV